MTIVGIRFHPCDKVYDFNPKDIDLKIGDIAIAQTKQGSEAGEVIYLKEIAEDEIKEPLTPVLRKATLSDLEKIEKYKKRQVEALKICHDLIKKHDLPMKLEGACFAFDGSKITLYFTAETRIDFRALVKDLTHHFQKSVRLQQIGLRDVAKSLGGYGPCGRELCCAKFLKEMKSIPTEVARLQQMAHRGSERISGVCGRLMCCLAYEAELYEKLAKKMPNLEMQVETTQGKGKVISRNILAQTVEVELGKETRAEFPVAEVKW